MQRLKTALCIVLFSVAVALTHAVHAKSDSIKDLIFWQVDAFANKPFAGNPAAIFMMQEPISDDLMQKIASEMNLSETAYVLLREGQNPLLRWFTPNFEIDLCGHATLAAAHIYFTEIHPLKNKVTFDTKFVGQLQVSKNSYGYTMDLPLRPGKKIDLSEVPQFVLDALTKEMPIEAYKARDLMLIYKNADIVRNIDPDFNMLAKYKDFIIVTSRSDNNKYDFISRFFCPNDGMPEDPVTGSAHCTLAPYWSNKLGKSELKSYQASKRGGELKLRVTESRVLITGEAISVIKGDLSYSNAD
ncbi:MAG: hypothetical protein COC15_00065 [Legionellales bacterium]|nr:MAG: hypothetical protein COC15_00065 [Legionellales bacterium]